MTSPSSSNSVFSSHGDIIGRDDIDDYDAILAVTNTDVDEVQHAVHADVDTIFTWDYERSRPALVKLYEKAKTSQWNARPTSTGRSTSTPRRSRDNSDAERHRSSRSDLAGTPFKNCGDKEWRQFGIESQNSLLSQFMHGEQGALLCTARIVETVPWIDAKYYAATQVMDEARHVEVFARYLDEKLDGHYPINANLKLLLDDILADSRWDITYLGMQIMVEGLALAAFGFMHQITDRAAAEEAAALRDERRGAPRRVRRALAAGVLRGAQRRRRCASARSSRSRPRCACATASCSRRSWERMGVDVAGGGQGAATRARPAADRSSRCCSPRSCRTARSSACSTPATAGCATASPRSA